MNDPKSLTTDELSTLFDDLDPTEVAADEVPENTSVPVLAPLPSGKYGVQLVAIDVDRDQNGEVRNRKLFTVDFKVVSPEQYDGRSVRFIKISAESKTRKVKGVDYKFTELVDLVHAFDPEFNVQNSPERAVRFLLEQIQNNSVVNVQLDWKAFDTKYFQQMNGDTLQNGSEAKKQLFKECSIRGQKNFDADGTLINPASGNFLKARLYMRWAYVPTA